MEGRAIARPNPVSARHPGRRIPASMEGRAIARPNGRQKTLTARPPELASMEGRAIARPNTSRPGPRRPRCMLQWRAGQLPGQTGSVRSRRGPRTGLQWRAGQLPGQTAAMSSRWRPWYARFNGGPGNCPAKRPRHRHQAATDTYSLQWRAGQLPGQTSVPCRREGRLPGRSFNGGPGNCPAKP